MLSKATVKFIKSLQLKKYRKQEQCFLVEGEKSVRELLTAGIVPVLVVATNQFMDDFNLPLRAESGVFTVSPTVLASLGEFQTNNTVLAVVRMDPNTPLSLEKSEFGLVLDDIRDPGNLGTIIRTADWYGIRKIVASPDTADVYNGKVIKASMGSFLRVSVYYTDLRLFLSGSEVPAFGAFLDGEPVHQINFGSGGWIVIGNESRGISSDLSSHISHRITIPKYGAAESLNAAVATAIICDNLRRAQMNR